MQDYSSTYNPWKETATTIGEQFHEASKLHFPYSIEADRGSALSASQQQIASRSFRDQEGARSVPLSHPEPQTDIQTILSQRRSRRQLDKPISLDDISSLLLCAAGITGAVPSENGDFLYGVRAWPSAGALYPLEVYIVVNNSPEVSTGVYHFRPLKEDLVELKGGDREKIIGDGYFHQEFIQTASVIVLIVAVFGRVTAKYGERGYRLALLDAGHLAQNLVLQAAALDLPGVPIGGFADDTVAEGLNLDGVDEAVIHSIAIGGR